jgi:hypothetical protein
MPKDGCYELRDKIDCETKKNLLLREKLAILQLLQGIRCLTFSIWLRYFCLSPETT